MAWEHAPPCSVCCDIIATLHSAMAALVSITLLIYPRFRFVRLASRATSCTSAMIGAYALRNSLLPYGVTSMSFRPGCHRPFHRSYCLRSLPLLSQDCVLSSFGSVSFASAIPRHCASAFPHFNRRHSSTLRPVFTQLAHTVFSGSGGNRTLAHGSFHD